MDAPSTVEVACPRCDVPIICTLETRPVPAGPTGGAELVASIPDLADRFAAHYRENGHVRTDVQLAPTPDVAARINSEISKLGQSAGAELAACFERFRRGKSFPEGFEESL